MTRRVEAPMSRTEDKKPEQKLDYDVALRRLIYLAGAGGLIILVYGAWPAGPGLWRLCKCGAHDRRRSDAVRRVAGFSVRCALHARERGPSSEPRRAGRRQRAARQERRRRFSDELSPEYKPGTDFRLADKNARGSWSYRNQGHSREA